MTIFGRIGLPFPYERCAPPSSATLLTFDEVPFLTEITDDYASQGVTFSGGGVLVTQPTDDDVGTESPPAALSNVAGGDLRLPDRFDELFGDAPTIWRPVDGDITARFAEPMTQVGVYVGLPTSAAELLAVAPGFRGGQDRVVTATLTLIDAAGTVIGSDTALLGPGPQPVRTCLYAQQPGTATADIHAVRVTYDPPVNETIDSFWFRRNLPLPETLPRGSIRITSPAAGALRETSEILVTGEIMSSVAPDRVYVHWWCVRDPQPPRGSYGTLRDGVYVISGSSATSTLLSDPGDPLRSVFYVRLSGVGSPLCGLRHPLRLRATAILTGTIEPRVEHEIEIEVLHPREISRASAVGIAAIEVTQGIRNAPVASAEVTTDPMLHVADRPTVVRVYPTWEGSLSSGTPLFAEIRAHRGSAWALPGSPALPETRVVVEGMLPTLEEQRRDIGASFNFRLPATWTTEGTTRLAIRVFPAAVSPAALDACTFCARPTYQTLNVVFAPGGHLDLHFFRVRLRVDSAGNGIDQRAPDFAEFGAVIRQLYQYLPLGNDAVDIREVQTVTWAGPITPDTDGDGDEEEAFMDAMRRTYLVPAGITGPDARHRGTLYGFYFAGVDGCAGKGWLDEARFRAGACTWVTTPTHEAVHTLGVAHASNAHNESSGGGFDAAYPGACGQVSYEGAGALALRTWGTDVHAVPILLIPPDVNETIHPLEEDSASCADPHVHDFMSYGGGTTWISPYTWTNVLERTGAEFRFPVPGLTRAPVDSPSDPVLSGRGLLASRGLVDSSESSRSAIHTPQLAVTVDLEGDGTAGEALLVDRAPVADAAGPVEVEALDAAGKSVAVYRTAVSRDEYGMETNPIALLPTDGWVELVVRRNGSEIARQRRSAAAPAVTLIAPAAGTPWDTELEVRLETSDADGDNLLATVELSVDGGATWRPVSSTPVDEPQQTISVPRESLTFTGGEALARAQVTDGLWVAVSEAVAVNVGPSAPIPVILSPSGADPVHPDALLELRGDAWSGDGTPLPDRDLKWVMDGNVVGHGRVWVIGPLAEGMHNLELRAAAGGTVETAAVEITAALDADGDGMPDGWESENGLDANDANDGGLDNDRDGLPARDEHRWQTDPHNPDTDGDGIRDGLEVITGGDPLNPASGPADTHGLNGLVPARTADELPVILLGVVAVLLAVVLAALAAPWWRRRGRLSF